MTLMRNSAKVAAVGLTVALGITGCGGGSSKTGGTKTKTGAAGAGTADTKGTKGGTLTLLESADFDHLDPQLRRRLAELQPPDLPHFDHLQGGAWQGWHHGGG